MSSNASVKNVVHNKSNNKTHNTRKVSNKTTKASPTVAKKSSHKQHSSPKPQLNKCRLSGLNIPPTLYDTLSHLGASSGVSSGVEDGLVGVFSGGPGSSTNSVVRMTTEFYLTLNGSSAETDPEVVPALPFQDLGIDVQSLGEDLGHQQYKQLTSAQLFIMPRDGITSTGDVLVAGGTCMTAIADTLVVGTGVTDALPRAVQVFSHLSSASLNRRFVEVSRINIQKYRDSGYTFLDYSKTTDNKVLFNIFRVGLFNPNTGVTMGKDYRIEAKVVLHWEYPMSYATQFTFSQTSRVPNLTSKFEPSEKPLKFGIQQPKSVRKGGI